MAKYKSQYTGPQIDAGIRPYKVYTVLLNAGMAVAPVPTVLENSLGNVIWSYLFAGTYKATLTGAFTLGKTIFTIMPFQLSDFSGGANSYIFSAATVNDVRFMRFSAVGIPTDGLSNVQIEIRVYP